MADTDITAAAIPHLHHVAVLNRSTVVSDRDASRYAKALQIQARHFAEDWGIGAKVYFVPSTDTTSDAWRGKWNLVILDTSDEANALGYHDLTPEGLPVGKAFAKTDLQYGAHVSVTLSHEFVEMLGDPDINLQVSDDNDRIYAYETADPVEADELGYTVPVDGAEVLLSDYVTPEWFSPTLRGVQGVKFDRLGHVSAPFELAPGGYISYTDSWPPNWQQIFNSARSPVPGNFLTPGGQPTAIASSGDRPRVGSRRERRRTPLTQWVRSAD